MNNIEDRIRRAIGDFVIQIHALQIENERLQAELAKFKPAGPVVETGPGSPELHEAT